MRRVHVDTHSHTYSSVTGVSYILCKVLVVFLDVGCSPEWPQTKRLTFQHMQLSRGPLMLEASYCDSPGCHDRCRWRPALPGVLPSWVHLSQLWLTQGRLRSPEGDRPRFCDAAAWGVLVVASSVCCPCASWPSGGLSVGVPPFAYMQWWDSMNYMHNAD